MEPIHTERLILRLLTPEWSNKTLAFYERNRPFFDPWEPERNRRFYTLTYQEKMLYYDCLAYTQKKHVRFWIFEKEDPLTPIGTVSFHNIVRGVFQSCTIGYKIDFWHTRQGFALEAVQKACTVMFEDFSIHRIEAYIHTKNTSSLSFIEKAGFQKEGVKVSYAKLHDTWEDHACYSLITPYPD